MSTAAEYRRLYEYEKDSHAKVVASLRAVSEEGRAAEGFQKAVDLLLHLVDARRLWLYRFGVAKEGPAGLFSKNVALSDVEARLEAMQSEWSAYLGALTDAELAKTFEYQSLDGPRYRNTIGDILTQLFGHSWYHRGQIALLLRTIGATPAETDFVFWTREALAPEPPLL